MDEYGEFLRGSSRVSAHVTIRSYPVAAGLNPPGARARLGGLPAGANLEYLLGAPVVAWPRASTERAPRVSVIIAFLNAHPYLQEAIDSVIGQTFEDWELLLVDDGSTDASLVTARRAVARAPNRVSVLTHPNGANRGLPASRNLGIRRARGDLIALLDADDVWMPDKLARQVEALDRHPSVGLVYGPSEWWHGWTGRAEDRQRDCVPDLHVAADVPHLPPSLLPVFLGNAAITPCPSSIMVRRDVAEQVGHFEERFNGALGLYEDQAFVSKVALAVPILRLDGCVARYRQHAQQMTSARKAAEHHGARRFFLEWLSARLHPNARAEHAAVHHVLAKEYRALVPTTGDRMRGWAARAVRSVGRCVVPPALRPWVRNPARLLLSAWRMPVLRHIAMMRARRLMPMYAGRVVGTQIVRAYWADFLERHRGDVRDHALEVGTTDTVRQYGGGRLIAAHAIDLARHSPYVTITADLSRADNVPGERYDCFILQFTMHVIADVKAALYHAIRLLKPGGVLLVNFSCVDAQFPEGYDMGTGRPLWVHWCFTPLQVHNLLRRVGLAPSDYTMDVYGNLFARVAYELNMPAEALTRRELTHHDPAHPVLVCARIARPPAWRASPPDYRDAWVPDALPDG
jgi:GT2 family glycosyltransferase